MIRRPRRSADALARRIGCLAALALAACGDGGSTEPATAPATMIQLSVPVDTVVTGERTDPPISVRVEDALGNAVEGVPVRFEVTRGEGQVAPGVAVSSQDGVAESVFESGTSPGETEVSVDIPSAPNVPVLRFLVLAQASDSVVLSLVDGDGQRAETGSQLPLPFVLQARTPRGGQAGGVEIVFRLVSGASGVLTDEAVLTGGDGRAQTVLTLGRQPREVLVRAFARGGVYSDTVEFSATAIAQHDGRVVLDSTGAGGLVAGAEATLHGRGFSPIVTENDVRIEGEPAEVISASGTQLTVRLPSFSGLCLPVRDVGVRVLVGEDASNGPMWPLQPAEPLVGLDVGESVTRRGPAAIECLQFAASDAAAEYRLVVGDAGRVAGARTNLRLATRVPVELGGSSGAAAVVPPEPDRAVLDAALARSRPDLAIRSATLRGLISSRVAVSRGAPPAASGIPVVGDTLTHMFALQSDLVASCSNTSNVIRGLVRAVGRHLLLVEDLTAPGGGFEPDQWAALGAELDRFVAPADTAHFGPYADLDGNGRVIVLFTPQVNELDARVGGFFLPLDLAARSDARLAGGVGQPCPASNEAEILYLAVADPEGQHGPALPPDVALRETRALVAHELQHLISAERRALGSSAGFGAIEEGWLDEALSELAEEIVGLASLGLSPRGDYTFDQVANTREEFEAFRTYQLDNFLNLSLYLADPSETPTIGGTADDEVGGLRMRGFGWFLMRWLADHATDQRAFLRALVGGGQNAARGVANVERVTGEDWADLLSDFSVSLVTDDTSVEGLPDRFRIATWNFRDVFTSLNQSTTAGALFPSAFALRATRLPVETAVLDFDVGASSVRYFTLATVPDAPPLSVSIRMPGGGPRNENTEPQVTIVRTR